MTYSLGIGIASVLRDFFEREAPRPRMTPTRLLKTILLALTLTTATSAHAVLDLTGVTVQGTLTINGLATNFFDPGNIPNKVPPGFGNSLNPPGSGEAEAIVSDSIVEFGYSGAVDANFAVNFSTNGLVQVSASANPFSSVEMHFSGPAFTSSVTLMTITGSPFIPVASYTPNNLAFMFSPTGFPGVPFSGTYLLNIQGTPPPQLVPEPASLTLVGFGLIGIIARYRKRT